MRDMQKGQPETLVIVKREYSGVQMIKILIMV